MGEITEALRRAKLQRGAGANRTPAESATSRAVPDALDGVSYPPEDMVERADWPSDENGPSIAIPQTRDGPWEARAVVVDPSKAHTERFRRFAIRVRSEMEKRHAKTVLVTSSVREEGKTVTACNLALAMASVATIGRIALLEFDTRRPSIARAFGITPRVGIEDVLSGNAPLRSACIRTELPSLDLYLVREAPDKPHELLSRPNTSLILREIGQRYRIGILDTPPVLPVPDVSLILDHVGACLAVIRSGVSRIQAVRETLEQLPQEKLIGFFFNDVGGSDRREYYDYYARGEDER